MRTEARYELVRQNCRELTGAVRQWMAKSMTAQDESRSTATEADYLATLAGGHPVLHQQEQAAPGQWIACQQRATNWNLGSAASPTNRNPVPVPGRWLAGKRNVPPEDVVEEMIPGERMLRNPFTGEVVFRPANDPYTVQRPVAGAIAMGGVVDKQGFTIYGLCFQGADNLSFGLTTEDSFQDGQNITTLEGIGRCVLVARVR